MIKKILKYWIWGWIWAVTDLFFLWIFTDIAWIYYIYSAILSFCIAFFVWFFFQKYITFWCKKRKHLVQGFLFLIFQLIWLLVNLLLLWILVDKFHYNYMYVAVFNKIIIFAWNFFMNHKFNFK